MYIVDGIAYASEPGSELRIEEARVVNDLCMLVKFSTGEERLFDASGLLDVPAFAPLRDQAVFNSNVVEHGVLCWQDGAIDIAPEKVYELSYPYTAVDQGSLVSYA